MKISVITGLLGFSLVRNQRADQVEKRVAVGDEPLQEVEDLVREAEKAAEEAAPAEDAAELISGEDTVRSTSGSGWSSPSSATDFGVFRGFAAQLGETLREAEGIGRKLYGFAEHGVTSTFVGNSAGLRARYDQPGGRLELNAKSADLSRSAWAGASTRDFTDVDVAALDAGLAERLSWQERKVELPAGRYETLLPPTAVSDMLIYMYWSAGARDAGEGRTVFSKPGGGTRIGERLSPLPVDLFSDPAYPGLECAPFVVAHSSGRDSSVFDNGLPAGRDGEVPGAVKIGEHGRGMVTTGDGRNGIVSPAARDRVRAFVRQRLGGLNPSPVGEVTCLYTSTANEDFILDRPGGGPFVVASPCSGHGAKFAPLLGEVIADLAAGAPTPDPRFTLAAHLARKP